MESLAAILHDLGLLAHGGPLLLFAVMLPIAGRSKGLEPWTVDRCWRAWAPASGVALGALILGGLLRYHQLRGDFSWGVEQGQDLLFLVKHLIFLLFWVNYAYTEIWVAEPMRRLDSLAGPPGDLPAYMAARTRVIRRLCESATALVAMAVLACLPA